MTPKTSSTTQPFSKEEKKARIAHAAIGVFAEKGISKAKMIEVAEAAGVGKGTIYEYFRSKDDLFEFAVNRFFDTMNDEIHSQLAQIDDPAEQLEVFIRSTFNSIRAAGSEMHIMFEIWAEGVRRDIEYFDLKGMYAGYRELLSHIISEGMKRGQFRDMDPLLNAAIIIGALDGLMLQWNPVEDALDLDTIPGECVDLIIRGLSAEH